MGEGLGGGGVVDPRQRRGSEVVEGKTLPGNSDPTEGATGRASSGWTEYRDGEGSGGGPATVVYCTRLLTVTLFMYPSVRSPRLRMQGSSAITVELRDPNLCFNRWTVGCP